VASGRGRIYTNLDLAHLTPSQREAWEQSQRRKEYIREQYRKAEEPVQQGVSSAGRRFSWQRAGVYSYSPEVDEDIDVILQHTSLPVKERVTHENGDKELVLGPAALEALRLGYFCSECEERQPESTRSHIESLERARRMGITVELYELEDRSRCAYCFAPLGMGDELESFAVGDMTSEQKQILRME